MPVTSNKPAAPPKVKHPILLSKEDKKGTIDLDAIMRKENRDFGFLQKAADREAYYAQVRKELWEARWPGCWIAAVRNYLADMWASVSGLRSKFTR